MTPYTKLCRWAITERISIDRNTRGKLGRKLVMGLEKQERRSDQ